MGALGVMESMLLDATTRGDIEGIVLRLGLFYGPEVGSTKFMTSMLRKRMMFLPGGGRGKLSWIHVEDGASAIVLALEKAPA
ncbi:MAG: NAD-dependent epimerase/dehydratase family protein, partial [Actinomycetota bacterium]